MELEHSFTVPVPKERAWDVLLDVERVAPCMPGATLDSVDGDVINGRIKVKVGPISMTYTGKAEIVEKDEAAGVIRMDASGKETKGAGTASATVRSFLEGSGRQTRVTVQTTMNVTGKPAQFGRGVMNEVGGKLIGIFADNLAAMLAESEAESAPSSVAGQADLPIEDLHLNARTVSVLRKDGITTASQLTAKTSAELLALDGIGPASIDEITAKLAEHGLALASAGDTRATSADDEDAQDMSAPAANGTASRLASTAAANGQGTGSGAAPPVKAKARRRPVRRKDDSLNLLKVAGIPVLKRSLPVLAGVTAVIIISWRRRLRRH
jgi:carbon monoxide dehydrogenase subunit G